MDSELITIDVTPNQDESTSSRDGLWSGKNALPPPPNFDEIITEKQQEILDLNKKEEDIASKFNDLVFGKDKSAGAMVEKIFGDGSYVSEYDMDEIYAQRQQKLLDRAKQKEDRAKQKQLAPVGVTVKLNEQYEGVATFINDVYGHGRAPEAVGIGEYLNSPDAKADKKNATWANKQWNAQGQVKVLNWLVDLITDSANNGENPKKAKTVWEEQTALGLNLLSKKTGKQLSYNGFFQRLQTHPSYIQLKQTQHANPSKDALRKRNQKPVKEELSEQNISVETEEELSEQNNSLEEILRNSTRTYGLQQRWFSADIEGVCWVFFFDGDNEIEEPTALSGIQTEQMYYLLDWAETNKYYIQFEKLHTEGHNKLLQFQQKDAEQQQILGHFYNGAENAYMHYVYERYELPIPHYTHSQT